MASARLIAQRYAQALHSLASEYSALVTVDSHLELLAGLFKQNPDLAEGLANPRLSREAKARILSKLLPGGDADALVKRVALLMTRKGRAGLLPELKPVYDEIAMAAAGRVVAKVTSARPLADEGRQRLKASLNTMTGKSITLEESVDDTLLGGVTVQIGSKFIDGSLRGRLEKLQDSLLRAPVASVGADA